MEKYNVELEGYQLEFIEKNGIDLEKLVRDSLDKLIAEDTE